MSYASCTCSCLTGFFACPVHGAGRAAPHQVFDVRAWRLLDVIAPYQHQIAFEAEQPDLFPAELREARVAKVRAEAEETKRLSNSSDFGRIVRYDAPRPFFWQRVKEWSQ